tara:strand:+ start:462 stop:629 length:168 start_codon:yes stop_codon:yes gene_type:complete
MKYRIVAEMSTLLEAFVEAKTLEEAETMAQNMDGGNFQELENSGGWQVTSVEEQG